jgi:hypothetical protein
VWGSVHGTRRYFCLIFACRLDLRHDQVFPLAGLEVWQIFLLGIALPTQVPPEAVRPARFLSFIPARESRCAVRFSRLSFSSLSVDSACLIFHFAGSFTQRAPKIHFPTRSSGCHLRILVLPASFPLENLSAKIFLTMPFFAAETFSFPREGSICCLCFSSAGVLLAHRAAALSLGVKTCFLWLLDSCTVGV